MPFTIQALNENNTVNIAQLSMVLNPITPIFTEADWSGGSSAVGVINVANTSPVDFAFFVSADWYAGGGDTIQNARLLAERLNIEVIGDPGGANVLIYDGSLAGLIQQPPGGYVLGAGQNVNVQFTLSLPDANATDLIQGMSIEFDLVFVAVEA